jgi:beta-mannosidase
MRPQATDSDAMTETDLSGQWFLASLDGEHACVMDVPGDAHSALIAAGIIPHPYVGRNELDVRWVAERDWKIERRFQVTRTKGDDWLLHLTYLDTVADIEINGQQVLHVDNSFRRHCTNVRNALRDGENTITIVFRSNVAAAAAKNATQPFPIPHSAMNCPIPYGNMLRKPHCHFGWDWNLAIMPFGLYGDIKLREQGPVSIENVRVRQNHNDNGSVDLEVEVMLIGHKLEKAQYAITFKDDARLTSNAVRKGFHFHTESFHIAKPELWWPAGSGAQKLYDLHVRCGDDERVLRVGLRKLELITTPDETGARFAFKVNDHEIFCRGANWIPASALPSGATPELTEKLLRSAVDANMNMIRVWGGGFYERDFFYGLCDEFGLLVWQDFMFACSLYPSTPEFLAQVRGEVEYQVSRLGYHACLALWCGDNELLGALNWFEEPRKNRDRYLVNYDRLNYAIEETLRSTDETAIWWPSSPSPGPMSYGDQWHDDSRGDMHFWSVWHEGKDFEYYRDVRPRFCSEFGFQSFPSMRTIRSFAEEKDFNIASPVMEHHQKNAGGNARIAETMFRYFRFPQKFEDFVYVSQVQQGLAMRTAIEYWRSLKPHCMGTLYWQLNDTWPVASWSGLNNDGSWKLLHYIARRFYAPVAVFAYAKGDEVIFMGVNDTLAPQKVTLVIEGRGSSEALIPDDKAIEITRMAIPDAIIHFKTIHGDHVSPAHYAPRPYKSYELHDPGLSHDVKATTQGAIITVKAQRTAYYVALESTLAGHFNDNAFDLLPGEERAVTFTAEEPSADIAHSFTIRNLYNATY